MIAFSLATRDDDAGIRHLLHTNAMPGRIRVRFEREPSYFAGCTPDTDVLVARDGARVAGVACRTIRKLYVNGVAEDVGYLGQLRVDRAYRGQLLTARGYRVMRELHEQRPARGYYTTIVDGNAEAEGVLVNHARRGMPRYRFLERLFTFGLRQRKLPLSLVRAATNVAAVQNLFPAYEPQGEIVTVPGASAALVDQRAYKQTVIDGYAGLLRFVRPLFRLPKPNTVLRHAYVTHFSAEDAKSARELIEALLEKARGFDHILLGFTESDPLLHVARTFQPIEYTSSIYTVSFDDRDDFHDRLLARPRALDIAAL